MRIPAITGIIRRRILLNYRISPEVVEAILPDHFRPKLINGYSIAGICLIRLEEIRPKGFPSLIGLSSENSAHRIAVEWDDPQEHQEGVFVPRRDTDSRMNSLAGGRIFPGVSHHSSFVVNDSGGAISMRISPTDMEKPLVELDAEESNTFPGTSIFGSLEVSSAFFEKGSIGYSSRPDSPTLEGLRLKALKWVVTPLEIHSVSSAFFDDTTIFPAGSITFDHALLMRNIPHEWHSEPAL